MRGLPTVASALLVAILISCGTTDDAEQPTGANPRNIGLGSLPSDGVQPWERLDANGKVIPAGSGADLQVPRGPEDPRHSSAFGPASLFTPGVERFLDGGDVTDNAEAASFLANSYGIYRFTLAGAQPSAIAVDANLTLVDGALSQYWIAVSDYGLGHWQWRGPFSEPQITLTLDDGDFTSSLGNVFVAIYVPEASALDLVGIAVQPVDDADTTAPPVPAAPQATPVNGGLELTWPQVIAGDLAGYRIYWSYSPFTNPSDNGVNLLPYLEGQNLTVLPVELNRMVWIALSAVDLNGNMSALSPTVFAKRLPKARPLGLAPGSSKPQPTANIGEPFSITASGADSYDFDTDGDGTFDITGVTTGTAQVDTSKAGIIRPRVRGTSDGGSAVALGSISLIVIGNQRPVANAQCTPQMGHAPLTVAMNGTGEDFDGTISEYAWDFNGDGIYDHNSPADGITGETYSQPGLYNAKLRVTDDQGAWDVDTLAVQVLASELHIEALPDYAAPGQQIELMVHSNAQVTKYEWDLDGDGTFERDTGLIAEAVISYSVSGPQTPRVRATFENGAQSITFVCVLVSGFAQQHGLEGGAQLLPRSSLAIIAGKPAIAFAKGSPLNLYFRRATTPDGSSWGGEIVVDTVDGAGNRLELIEAGGVPVIAYENNVTGDLVFARSVNAAGSSWHPPLILDFTVSEVQPSLAIVAGNPAISYCDTGDLKYIRATDASGVNWDTPITLDSADFTGLASCLAVISGRPAVSYLNETLSNLRYIRANDATGASWGGPQSVASANSLPTQLMEAGSAPIICYQSDTQPFSLKLTRGIYPDGGSWFDGVVLQAGAPNADTGYHIALGKVNGLPVLAFGGLAGSYLMRATDQDALSWGAPEQFSVNLAAFNSLAEIEGKPALAYCTSANKLSFATKY